MQDINIIYSKFSFVYVVIYTLSCECIHFSLYLRYIGAFQGVCILPVHMAVQTSYITQEFHGPTLVHNANTCKTPCVHDCNVTSLYHVHTQSDNFLCAKRVLWLCSLCVLLRGPNLTRRHHGWSRARKISNFRASRLPETAISRVFVKKKYSTSEKIFN